MSERQASNFRRSTYTPSQLILMSRLNLEHIPFTSEHPIERPGEFNQFGQQKYWVIDIFIRPNICIEVDGSVHDKNRKTIKRDGQKNDWFDAHGYAVLRFRNVQALDKTDSAVQKIKHQMKVKPPLAVAALRHALESPDRVVWEAS